MGRGRKPGSLLRARCVCCGVTELSTNAVFYRCAACKGAGLRAGLMSDKDECGAEVARAVKEGRLLPVKGQSCADCGTPATEYDHRDYNRPLDVAPVCRGCNFKRGPATPRPGSLARVVAKGEAPYRSLHRATQLFQAMGLPLERLAGLPKRLTADHWRDLLPLFDVEGGDVLVHESSLHPLYV